MAEKQPTNPNFLKNVLFFSGLMDAIIGTFLLYRFTLSSPFGIVGLMLIVLAPLIAWYAWTRVGEKSGNDRLGG